MKLTLAFHERFIPVSMSIYEALPIESFPLPLDVKHGLIFSFELHLGQKSIIFNIRKNYCCKGQTILALL